jgi:hypothetical protein
MGHSAGFGFVLWAIAQDLSIRNGPQRRIWLSALGHGAAKQLVVRYGPKSKTNYQSAELHNGF